MCEKYLFLEKNSRDLSRIPSEILLPMEGHRPTLDAVPTGGCVSPVIWWRENVSRMQVDGASLPLYHGPVPGTTVPERCSGNS